MASVLISTLLSGGRVVSAGPPVALLRITQAAGWWTSLGACVTPSWQAVGHRKQDLCCFHEVYCHLPLGM